MCYPHRVKADQDGMMGSFRSGLIVDIRPIQAVTARAPKGAAWKETPLMQARWIRGAKPLTPRPLRRAPVIIVGTLALMLTFPLTGCGGASNAAVKPQTCGTGRTAANVPVEIEVNRGQVSCAVAITVERSYAAAIVAGQAPGNGGGGPITINGWKCQGFNTPELLKTGDVSKCARDGVEIVAILKSPA